jgi:hypothetical protein
MSDFMSFKYGKPIAPKEMPKARKRLPQYDECLREFLNSESEYWEVNLDALPSKDVMVVLSSLKWRTKNNSEFSGVKVVMNKGKIFLEKVEG